MRAGRLRQKVSLFTPSSAPTALGEIETTNNLIGTFYADVTSRPANETSDDGTLTSTTAYKVLMRYNTTDLTDISPSSTLEMHGRVLRVRSVSFADFRRRLIEIVAEEAR